MLLLLLASCTEGVVLPRSTASLTRRASVVTRKEVLRPLRRTASVAAAKVAAQEVLPPSVLSYVDCRPYDDNTIQGRFFLATNLAFFATGNAVRRPSCMPLHRAG